MQTHDFDYFEKNIYPQIRPLFSILDLDQPLPTKINDFLLDDIEETKKSLCKLGNKDMLSNIFAVSCYFIWLKETKINPKSIPFQIDVILSELDKYYIQEKDFYTFADKIELWKQEQEHPESIIFYFHKNNILPFYIPNILRIFWWYQWELSSIKLSPLNSCKLFHIQKRLYFYMMKTLGNKYSKKIETDLLKELREYENRIKWGKKSRNKFRNIINKGYQVWKDKDLSRLKSTFAVIVLKDEIKKMGLTISSDDETIRKKWIPEYKKRDLGI